MAGNGPAFPTLQPTTDHQGASCGAEELGDKGRLNYIILLINSQIASVKKEGEGWIFQGD